MNHAYKGNGKLIFVSVGILLLSLLTFFSDGKANFNFPHGEQLIQHITAPVHTTDTLPDSLKRIVTDTIPLKRSKNELDGPVSYHADDSMVLDIPGKKMFLYGKGSSVKYIDNELTAPQIQYDQGTSLITAFLVKDSLGNVIAYPSFKQGDFSSKMDTIQFNPKTQKGLTKGTYTQQGEMFIYGEKIKKVSPDVFYAFRGRFTTCNLDTPHFAFVSKKIKFINQKMAFTGPVHPEFEGVPVPVILPFGIYPLKQGRHSGLIAPTFTANDQLGLALENLGYYKILSDNWDVVLRGTAYSYGAWTASINPRYYKRYRYQGNFSYDVQQFKQNFKGDPDYSASRTMNVRWTHSADNKARPGVSFSASVNAASSKHNELVPNSPVQNFTNQLNSTINYSKVWKDRPYNLAISATHDQNTRLRLINLNLPNVIFNVNTLYPFRRKEPIGPLKWYENLGIALNTTARSLTSFYDTAGAITSQIRENLQWGASHNVPLTIALPQLGPVQVTPTVTYQERWYQRKFRRIWNPVDEKIDTSINEGFYSARDMSFGLNTATRIFGMYGFRKSSKIQAIRHEIRPTVSVNYKPNFNAQNFYDVQINAQGRTGRFSVFENSVYGSFSESRFAGLSFGIDNNVSMKVRNRKDTSSLRKVSLIDGLSVNGSYNFLADSFRLSNLSLNARTNILDKINLTATALLNPYQTDSVGDPIDKLVWAKNFFTLGRIQNVSVSLQTSFRGGDKTKSNRQPAVPGTRNSFLGQEGTLDASGLPANEYEAETQYMLNNPGEFADFSIPWSIDFSYSLSLVRARNFGEPGFTTRIDQNVRCGSSINLTPRWKLGGDGYYNITQKEIGTLSLYLSRDMHCWQMAINISPVGRYRFFSISISPKSGLLRDIKVNRTRYFYDL